MRLTGNSYSGVPICRKTSSSHLGAAGDFATPASAPREMAVSRTFCRPVETAIIFRLPWFSGADSLVINSKPLLLGKYVNDGQSKIKLVLIQ